MVDSIQITLLRLLEKSLAQPILCFCDELGIESLF